MQNSSSSLVRDVQFDGDSTLEESDPTCELEPGSPAVWSSPQAFAASARGDAPLAGSVHDQPLPGMQALRGRYRIEAAIGIGGFSIVYRARDLHHEAGDMAGARVAIKVLQPELMRSAAAVERLKAEFRCMRLLSHPNVLRVYDLDRDGDIWFQVMELLDGESLASTLRGRSGSSTSRRKDLDVLRGCADALAAAHEQGIVHGDVKPGNIIVTSSGGVRLIDFGTPAGRDRREAPLTAGTETLRATPAYASPQVLSGRAPEPRDDLFSLACVAFELLAGKRPFRDLDATTARMQGLRPADVAGLDVETARALAAGLAWNREDRPATVRQWIAMLEGATESAGAAIPVGLAASRTVGSVASRAAGPVASQRPAPYQPRVLSSTRFGWLVVAITATLVATVFALKPDRAPSSANRPAPAAPPAFSVAATPAAAVDHAKPLEPKQSVSFSDKSLTVNRAAPSASLRLKRDGAVADSAKASWRIVEATARAGRDFAGPTSGSLSFAAGQSMSTLVIPLLHGTDASGGVTFSVEIDRVDGRAGVGDIPRVTVHIR